METIAIGTTARRKADDHRFFQWLAVAMTLTILAGFARSYYLVLPGILPERTPLTPLLHLHGIVFTTWLLFYLVQSWLPGTGNLRLHRQLGQMGVPLLALLVVVGTITAFRIAALGLAEHDMKTVGFFAWTIGDIVVFATFIGAGLANRRYPERHKRWMALAMAGMMGPGLGRLMGAAGIGGHGMGHLAPPLLFGLSVVVWDIASRGRILPVTAWGFGLLALSEAAREALMMLPGWPAVAARLVAFAA